MDPTHRVLIIDDDAVNRRMAHVVFQKLGWHAETVDSGEQALLHLAAYHYDLVLLDISMPGMNGLEVCQRIRADHAHVYSPKGCSVLRAPHGREFLRACRIELSAA